MRTYLAIDLKSFYASVECVERGLDPLSTNLVVADASRTEKTICLAVSPSLKKLGIPGRPRLFEVVQKVQEANGLRRSAAPGQAFSGSSWDAEALAAHPELEISYITAPPRMAHYIRYSTGIYNIYLQYVAPEDIHVYSIDEVFMDVTGYLGTYRMTARELAKKILQEVLDVTGITATAGIGTNLYLCKVAMDIVAKHIAPDKNGVRIAELDEMSYRRLLWDHRPLTDFWRIGGGISRKLEGHGLLTMGDVARCSLEHEELLYQLFGVNAELLIDHAWGWEPCTIADIKAYRPASNSISSGQVLECPYNYEKTRLVLREMCDTLALDLVDKGLVTDQLVLTIGYDRENLADPEQRKRYSGQIVSDHYGRPIPKHAHGTANLERPMSSGKRITQAVLELYRRIADPELLSRRITLCANHLIRAEDCSPTQQLDLFHSPEDTAREDAKLDRERRRQETVLELQKRFGKNAVLKGMNLEEGATTVSRNGRIGGHKK